MKRIKKEILTMEILKNFNNKNKTVALQDIITLATKYIKKENEKNTLIIWIENHYRKNDFNSWWENQKLITANKHDNQRINILKKNFEALTVNKIQFLADFLTQDKTTKKITIDFETLKASVVL